MTNSVVQSLLSSASTSIRTAIHRGTAVGTLGMFLLGSSLVACSNPDTIRAPASPAPDPIAGAYPQITMASGLSGLLAHSGPIVEPSTPNRPMRVTVPVRSIQDGPTRTQYQFTWLDSAGRPLGVSGWKYELVPPRMERFFEASSLTTQATDWRLEIKIAS
jgi:hypothetical protein